MGSESALIPEAEISEILGLIELLNSIGGREDIYKLAATLQMELGDTLKVIRSAEMLKLVDTPGGDVVLEPLGKKITQAKITQRKALICSQIEKLPVFQKISEFLNAENEKQVSRVELLEKLAEILPNENAEQVFDSIVKLGRYAELFGYNDDSETFYLDQ